MPPEPATIDDASADAKPLDGHQSAANDAAPELARAVGKIAGLLAQDHERGTGAALRRMDEGLCPEFYRLYFAYGLENLVRRSGPGRELDAAYQLRAASTWGVILKALASMAGLHEANAHLGKALAHADVSELRFMKLVRQRGAGLAPQIQSTALRLAANRTPSDHLEFAHLVLTDAAVEAGVPRAESHRSHRRNHLAHNYFRALHTQKAD